MDRSGALVWEFGAEGEGPGEFRSITHLVRGTQGRLGIVDGRAGRFTVWGFGDGEPLSTVTLPPILFRPLGGFTDVLHGTYSRFSGELMGPAMRADPQAVVDAMVLGVVDIATGDIVREDPIPHPSTYGIPTECETGLNQGDLGTLGNVAFGTCISELVFRDSTGTLSVIQSPTYVPELPNDRDVQSYRDFLRSIGGENMPEGVLRQFRETPKEYLIAGRSLVYDGLNRLWVATQRDRDRFSYLDVYDGQHLAGTVRIRHRILGFDILGTTLVALVERPIDPGAGEIVPERGVDWYDVGSVFLPGAD